MGVVLRNIERRRLDNGPWSTDIETSFRFLFVLPQRQSLAHVEQMSAVWLAVVRLRVEVVVLAHCSGR